MSQNKWSIYYSISLGIILFLTITLVGRSEGYLIFIYAGLFFILNIIKDVIFHKLGYMFRGINVKILITINVIGLLLLVIWCFYIN